MGALAPFLLVLTLLCGGCTPGDSGRAPGVVLISIDTLRADALGCYGGSPSPSPNLDQLASEGVLFNNAVSPVPITLPAHGSMMTGLTPARHGIHYNLGHILRPEFSTLAEAFARQGFATAGFVSSLVLDRRFGLDQGFSAYEDDFSGQTHGVFGAERPGHQTVELAMHWLRIHQYEPFFLFVHLYEPHEPYEPPPEFARRFPDSPYLGEVATADAYVGQLLDGLRELGLADSTLVAVVGDHGEMLGEHGEDAHTYFIYQAALRVPFILRMPQQLPAARIDRLVGLVDVAPTLCGLLDVTPPPGIDGVDLSPLVLGRGEAPLPRPVVCESLTPTRYDANPLLGLVGERWKLIHTTRDELYDLIQDPGETSDLALLHPEIVDEQQRVLASLLVGQTASSETETAQVVDADTARRLAALGYAPSPLDSDFEFDPSRPDPKDLIAVHVAHTRALQFIANGEYEAAEPLSSRVIAALPDSWEAHLTLAKVEAGIGHWTEAIPLFERSLELKPAQYEALRGLGQAFSGLGQYSRAVEIFRRALPLDPEPPAAAVHLARALFASGRPDEGEFFLARAAQAASERPDVLRRLAQVLDELGRPEQATAIRERALALAGRQGRLDLKRVLEKELGRGGNTRDTDQISTPESG